jgi:hypothetical protein
MKGWGKRQNTYLGEKEKGGIEEETTKTRRTLRNTKKFYID